MASTAVKLRRSRGLSATATDEMVVMLKAIADPARLRILEILKDRPDLEACVCEFTEPLGLSQPTVSHHLKVLTNAGLLQRERRGSWAWFRLDVERMQTMATELTRDL